MHYKINTTSCGQCPNTADTNSVTCNIPNSITTEQTCVLTVEAVVCGNVSGIPSKPIVFVMKGLLIKLILYTSKFTTVTALVPNAPRINVTSEYSGETKKLTKISVQLVTSGLVCVTLTIIVMYLQHLNTVMTFRFPTTLLTSHTLSTTLTLPLVTHVAPSHCQLHLVMVEFVLACLKYLHLYALLKLTSVCLLLQQISLAMGTFLTVYI